MSAALGAKMSVGMVLFPNLTQLDLTGPYEVLAKTPNVEVFLVAKTLEPVHSEHGLAILPTLTFAMAPTLDILFVPGGTGISQAMQDDETLTFLRKHGAQASYITAVCTGSLLLAAAGLLQGYRATTHWLSLDLLSIFGVEAVAERVVVDRNRITGGGVTAGIDFGLVLAAELSNEAVAQEIQLMLEYDPQPPFQSGSPKTADPALVERVRRKRQDRQQRRRQLMEQIASRQTDSQPMDGS